MGSLSDQNALNVGIDPSGLISNTVVIQTVSVVLNNAQIQHLPTSPIELVPAPGVDKAVLVVAATGILNLTGNYSTDVNASVQLIYRDGFEATGAWWWASLLANPTSLGNPITAVFPPVVLFGSGDFANYPVVFPNKMKPNSALVVADWFESATNYTGGNTANTFKVTVYYAIVDL